MLDIEMSNVEKDLSIHGYNVEKIASAISNEMYLSLWETSLIKLCANLHDYGKLDIPENIIYKPGKLSQGEFEIMKQHSIYGYIYMRDRGYSHEMANIVALHHEDIDGSGYPYGLKGEDIPLAARIIRVADMYGSLREDRPWRKALSINEALDVMRAESFKFDKKVYEILFKLVGKQVIS